MIIFAAILFFILHFFPGYAFQKQFYKEARSAERLFIPAVLSLFLTPALFTGLTFAIGFESSLIFLPVIITMIGAYIFLKTGKQIPKISAQSVKSKIKKPVFVISASLFLILLLLFFLALPQFAFSRITDSHFHAAAVNEIRTYKSLPPDTACLPGEKLKYSWFPHLMTYLISEYSGLPTYSIFSFYGLYLFILFAYSVYILGNTYLSGNNAILSAFLAVILVYFYASFFLFSTQGYALPIISLAFYFMVKSFNNNGRKYKILAGFLVSSLIYIHGLSFVFCLIALISITTYSLASTGNLRRKMQSAAHYLLPLSAAFPFYLLNTASSKGLYMFQPLSGLFLYVSQMQYFSILLVILPFAAAKALKEKNGGQIQLLFSLVAIFAFVIMFVMPRNPNIYRNIFLSIFPLSLFGFYYLKGFSHIKIAAAAFLLILPWIFVYVDDLKNTFSAENFYGLQQYSASEWAGNNSSPHDRILAAPNPLYSGVSERKMIVCSDDFLRGWGYDQQRLKSSFGDTLSLFNSPSKDLIEKYMVKYIIYGDEENKFLQKYDVQPFDFAASSAFAAEYKSGNYTVYSVKDIKSLPEKPAVAFNFTRYSRWWEI